MTFHHDAKKNLLHFSISIPAFFPVYWLVRGPRDRNRCLQWWCQPSPIVFFDYTCWRSSAIALLVKLGLQYFHCWVDLSLPQHVLRFSVLLQVPQIWIRWTSMPLWNSDFNVSWLGCNLFLSHFCLFCFFTSFRTTWISSTLVKMTIPFCPRLFINKLDKAVTFSSQKGRTT